MTRRGHAKRAYHCVICEQAFSSKADLSRHIANHEDSSISKLICATCGWDSDDTHALELHQIQSSHTTSKPLHGSVKALAEPTHEMAVHCDRCEKTFVTQKQFSNHRSNMTSDCADWKHTPRTQPAGPHVVASGYVDLDKPKDEPHIAPAYEDSESSEAATNDSDVGIKCHDCKRLFRSMGQYNNHMLGCTPVPSATKARKVLQATVSDSENGASGMVSHTGSALRPVAVSRPMQQRQTPTSAPRTQHPSSSVSPNPAIQSATFGCNANGCDRIFRSEAGLRQHKIDVHGVGGQALNLTGRDSWMLSNRERERLRQEGQLQQLSASSRSHGGQRGRPAPRGGHSTLQTALPTLRQPLPQQSSPSSRPMTIQPRTLQQQPVPMPTSMNMGGAAELDQAKHIQAKILRLLIQADIFIQHDGKMNVCNIDWTRIGVAKQHGVVAMLDAMCHLPKVLQGEYIPAPKAFKEDYNAQYLFSDFKPSPGRNAAKPGLSAVALSCNKVVLADGRQEAVKIAAVDLVTCRILMNHLVCTDPHAEVQNWYSPVTGLFVWKDMEQARKAGYKVFKGWAGARDALHKFVDCETIIVGHNLRSDLDALRMIHGRAVDIAKVVEKAAHGPLSKAQLALDSLCRDYPNIILRSDPEYGRDSLMNAFAIREFVLWAIKNNERLALVAKQKSREYQLVMPRAAA